MALVDNSEIKSMYRLNQKVHNNTASLQEKDEYLRLLLKNGSISQKQYDDYKQGRNTDDLIKAGLIIGGIFLLTYVISELASDDSKS